MHYTASHCEVLSAMQQRMFSQGLEDCLIDMTDDSPQKEGQESIRRTWIQYYFNNLEYNMVMWKLSAFFKLGLLRLTWEWMKKNWFSSSVGRCSYHPHFKKRKKRMPYWTQWWASISYRPISWQYWKDLHSAGFITYRSIGILQWLRIVYSTLFLNIVQNGKYGKTMGLYPLHTHVCQFLWSFNKIPPKFIWKTFLYIQFTAICSWKDKWQ